MITIFMYALSMTNSKRPDDKARFLLLFFCITIFYAFPSSFSHKTLTPPKFPTCNCLSHGPLAMIWGRWQPILIFSQLLFPSFLPLDFLLIPSALPPIFPSLCTSTCFIPPSPFFPLPPFCALLSHGFGPLSHLGYALLKASS